MKEKVNKEKILLFVNELISLLNSGIIFSDALKILYSSEKNLKFKNSLKTIYKSIMQGNSIFKSFLPFKDIFGINFIYMLKVGELSGELTVCLEKIYKNMEYNLDNQKKVKSLLVYPIIVLVLSFFSVAFLLIFVLPNFILIFEENKIELPFATKILLFISKNFHFIIIFITLVFLMYFPFIRYIDNDKVKKLKKDKFLLNFIISGNLLKIKKAENLYYSLYTFLSSGITILDALEILIENEENLFIQDKIKKVHNAILNGNKIAVSLKQLNLFTERFYTLIVAGEESGFLIENFLQISKILNKEYDYKLKKVIAFIEPLSILILGLIILFVVLAIYLPILSISNIF